jgi:hypothetical protein
MISKLGMRDTVILFIAPATLEEPNTVACTKLGGVFAVKLKFPAFVLAILHCPAISAETMAAGRDALHEQSLLD